MLINAKIIPNVAGQFIGQAFFVILKPIFWLTLIEERLAGFNEVSLLNSYSLRQIFFMCSIFRTYSSSKWFQSVQWSFVYNRKENRDLQFQTMLTIKYIYNWVHMEVAFGKVSFCMVFRKEIHSLIWFQCFRWKYYLHFELSPFS